MAHFPKPFFRPKKNRWFVQLNGKHVNLGPDKDEAFRRYHALLARPQDTPPAAGTPNPLIVAVLDAFLDWLQKRVEEGTKASRTFAWYRRYLQSFATFSGEGYRVADLTVDALRPIHVYQWVDAQPGWKTGKRGAMTSVQRAFNWAARAGLLNSVGGKSPLAALEKPKQGRREQLVTEAEYTEVLTALASEAARDLVTLSWETGMRPNELFVAEARFFEADNGRLVFPVKHSKGKKTQRVVYLNDTALKIVRRCVLKYPVGALLRNTEGEAWNMASVNCLFQRVRRELGRRKLHALGLVPPKVPRLKATERQNPARRAEQHRRVLERRKAIDRHAWEHGTKYSLYAFRHAFCTEALENGVDAVTVSVLMGHRDTTMIARVYSHVNQRHEHMRQAANRARGA